MECLVISGMLDLMNCRLLWQCGLLELGRTTRGLDGTVGRYGLWKLLQPAGSSQISSCRECSWPSGSAARGSITALEGHTTYVCSQPVSEHSRAAKPGSCLGTLESSDLRELSLELYCSLDTCLPNFPHSLLPSIPPFLLSSLLSFLLLPLGSGPHHCLTALPAFPDSLPLFSEVSPN